MNEIKLQLFLSYSPHQFKKSPYTWRVHPTLRNADLGFSTESQKIMRIKLVRFFEFTYTLRIRFHGGIHSK